MSESATEIVNQWRRDFEDELFTMPPTGWPLLIKRIDSALADARDEQRAEDAAIARAEHRKGLVNLKDDTDSDYDLGYTEAAHLIAVNILAPSSGSYEARIRAEIAEKVKALPHRSLVGSTTIGVRLSDVLAAIIGGER